jgi:Na+-transporting methylmalonyl-CoA/oxaloacetate decarboxylase gamma subunit
MIIGIFGLVIGIVIQMIIINRLPEAKTANSISKQKSKEPGLSLKEILSNKYFRFIFLLVLFSMVGQYFVDYNFMGIARSQMTNEIELTSFIGIFFGLVKIVELLFRTLAAGRLMSKYGIKLGLLLLPILLLSLTLIALGVNFVASHFLLFFLLLAMLKLIDKVIRRSMEEPAVKTLYQPVDIKKKLQLQTSIEGKGKQIAVIIAGGVLVIFNLIPNFSIAAAAIILCFLIVAWIYYAYKTYNEYRVLLNNQLTAGVDEIEASHQYSNDIYFKRGLDSNKTTTKERSIKALHEIKPATLIPVYPQLAVHPDEYMRSISIKWLNERPLVSMLDALKKQREVEENIENQLTIEEIFDWGQSILNASESEVNEWVRSEKASDRIKAASWICHIENQETVPLLDVLLKDKDPDVVQAACFYISTIQNSDFLKLMLSNIMNNKSYEHSIFKNLLLKSGISNELLRLIFEEFEAEKQLVLLEKAFRDSLNNSISTLEIINTVGKIDHAQSKAFLISKLDIGNWAIQYYLLDNLKQLGYRASESELTNMRQLILKETGFCAWILATINDLGRNDYISELRNSLEEQLESSKSKIFNILSFLYPKDAIVKIESNLKSGVQEKEVLALEMADILLEEIHKDIIFPLFDKISITEKIKNLGENFPQQVLNQETRLKNVIFYDYAMLNNVTRALAINALSSVSNSISYEITAQIYGHDYLLKETAYEAIHKLDSNLFIDCVERENEITKIDLQKIVNRENLSTKSLSRLEIVGLIKDQKLFKEMPYWKINIISEFFTPIFFQAEQIFNQETRFEDMYHIFIEGEIQLKSKNGSNIILQNGDLVGFYDHGLSEREVVVVEESVLLSITKPNFHSILQGLPDLCKSVYNLFIEVDNSPIDEAEIMDEIFLEIP